MPLCIIAKFLSATAAKIAKNSAVPDKAIKVYELNSEGALSYIVARFIRIVTPFSCFAFFPVLHHNRGKLEFKSNNRIEICVPICTVIAFCVSLRCIVAE